VVCLERVENAGRAIGASVACLECEENAGRAIGAVGASAACLEREENAGRAIGASAAYLERVRKEGGFRRGPVARLRECGHISGDTRQLCLGPTVKR
jgi:hypothetical protein